MRRRRVRASRPWRSRDSTAPARARTRAAREDPPAAGQPAADQRAGDRRQHAERGRHDPISRDRQAAIDPERLDHRAHGRVAELVAEHEQQHRPGAGAQQPAAHRRQPFAACGDRDDDTRRARVPTAKMRRTAPRRRRTPPASRSSVPAAPAHRRWRSTRRGRPTRARRWHRLLRRDRPSRSYRRRWRRPAWPRPR